MFAVLGGAVNFRLQAPSAVACDRAPPERFWLHHLRPSACGCVFRDPGFGILVASVYFQFSITIGNGCCCSPSRVLELLRTLFCYLLSSCSALIWELSLNSLFESKSSRVWCSDVLVIFSLLSLNGDWTYAGIKKKIVENSSFEFIIFLTYLQKIWSLFMFFVHLPTSMRCFFFSPLLLAACFFYLFISLGLLPNEILWWWQCLDGSGVRHLCKPFHWLWRRKFREH